MDTLAVMIILGILAFMGLVATAIGAFIIVKMKKCLDKLAERDQRVGECLSSLYKANTFDLTRECIGNLMDNWLGY